MIRPLRYSAKNTSYLCRSLHSPTFSPKHTNSIHHSNNSMTHSVTAITIHATHYMTTSSLHAKPLTARSSHLTLTSVNNYSKKFTTLPFIVIPVIINSSNTHYATLSVPTFAQTFSISSRHALTAKLLNPDITNHMASLHHCNPQRPLARHIHGFDYSTLPIPQLRCNLRYCRPFQ